MSGSVGRRDAAGCEDAVTGGTGDVRAFPDGGIWASERGGGGGVFKAICGVPTGVPATMEVPATTGVPATAALRPRTGVPAMTGGIGVAAGGIPSKIADASNGAAVVGDALGAATVATGVGALGGTLGAATDWPGLAVFAVACHATRLAADNGSADAWGATATAGSAAVRDFAASPEAGVDSDSASEGANRGKLARLPVPRARGLAGSIDGWACK